MNRTPAFMGADRTLDVYLLHSLFSRPQLVLADQSLRLYSITPAPSNILYITNVDTV